VLGEARARGFLGPGPVEEHLDHSRAFAEVVAGLRVSAPAPQGADLGSGGGVPGLPLAVHLPAWRWTLVESGVRRAAFLREAVVRCDLGHRVAVLEARAEEVGRLVGARGTFDVVVARGFGPPAVVAECGAPLLQVDGWAVVSEPPGGNPARWPTAGLALVGMERGSSLIAGSRGAAFQVLRQAVPCPDRYPRRVGVPAKRPLF